MNTAIDNIQKNIEKVSEVFNFDIVFGENSPAEKNVKDFIKQSHISFIKNEIDRLEIQYVNENPVDCIDGETPVETYGYEELENVVIKRQVDRHKKTLELMQKL